MVLMHTELAVELLSFQASLSDCLKVLSSACACNEFVWSGMCSCHELCVNMLVLRSLVIRAHWKTFLFVLNSDSKVVLNWIEFQVIYREKEERKRKSIELPEIVSTTGHIYRLILSLTVRSSRQHIILFVCCGWPESDRFLRELIRIFFLKEYHFWRKSKEQTSKAWRVSIHAANSRKWKCGSV